jgi:uncharacterized coiled-coil protein SlyX
MKGSNWVSIILVVLVIGLGVLWFMTYSQKSKLANQNDSLSASFERATNTINEIQSNLEEIEGGLSGQLFSGGEMPKNAEDRRTQIINSISNMKRQIEADKKRISDLEAQLAKSSVKIKGIESLVAKLKASLADKEKIVAELTTKLGISEETLLAERQLSAEEIAKRDKEIAEKQATILAQEKDINTIFYAFGTRKDLIDKKIISREGGLLGLGKVSTLQKSTDLDKYRTFSLVEVDGISFPYTKNGYSILSNQTASSYKVERAGDSYILKVTNKELFRKYKLLVIEIL